MNPRNLTREAIEQSNDIEPYCFETDREEQWFNVGLQYGLDIADSDPISPWIRVEDDLPCNHEELINGNVTYPVFVRDINNIYGVTIMMKFIKWDFMSCNITHWMPIPKLPKE